MLIKRTSCRLCGSEHLVAEINFPHAVIADKYASESSIHSCKYPLDLFRCSDCGHIQVLDILDLNVLFSSDYTYKPSRNKKLVQHFEYYAQNAISVLGYSPRSCLDIGSNDGLFLSCLQKYAPSASILGIDPAEEAVDYANTNSIPTLQNFFTKDVSKSLLSDHGHFDIVSANNVFAHNDDLNSFAEGVSNLLPDQGLFCFEISYLLDIVTRTLIGTQFHEHLSHHSISSLLPFLKKYDLHLFHAQRVNTQGGALICYARKSSNKVDQSDDLVDLLSLEKDLDLAGPGGMQLFRRNIIKYKNKFRTLYEKCKTDNFTFIGYGAARSLNFFASFLEVDQDLQFVIEDNNEKHNKYLYSSNCRIVPFDDKLITPNTVIIPFAWVHSDSIVDNLSTLHIPCKILTLYPDVRLISLD